MTTHQISRPERGANDVSRPERGANDVSRPERGANDVSRPERGATVTHTIIDSPVGSLVLVATDGALSGVYMDEHRHRPDPATFGDRDDTAFDDVRRQLGEYFAGDRTRFELPLHLEGTDFQRRVWEALQEIPYGRTWSYGQLAAHLGTPGASRAVGLANGRNPVSIVVPCHRVVGADGTLTGYGGGLERKRLLLDLERRHLGEVLC